VDQFEPVASFLFEFLLNARSIWRLTRKHGHRVGRQSRHQCAISQAALDRSSVRRWPARPFARSRVQLIVGKFQDAIREASSNDAERGDVSRLFDRYVADGREAVSARKTDCKGAERQIAGLEQSIGAASPPPAASSLADAIAPSAANAAVRADPAASAEQCAWRDGP